MLEDLGDVEVSGAQDIRGKAERLRPCTIIYDLFQEKTPPYQESGSGIHTIAIGAPGTVPYQQAVENNFFAILDRDGKEAYLREVCQHSQKILNLEEQNRYLRNKVIRLETENDLTRTAAPQLTHSPFEYAEDIISRIENEQELSSHFLKLIHSHLRIPKSGVFIKQGNEYKVIAGNRLTGDLRQLSYSETHPFAEWLRENLITLRLNSVDGLLDEPDKIFLRDNLKRMQAEAIFPMFADGHMIGWLFTGRRNDGHGYTYEIIEDLESISQQMSACLGLCRKTTSTQSEAHQAQLLLQAIPGTWVIADDQGEIISQCEEAIPLPLKEALYETAQSGVSTDKIIEGRNESCRVFTHLLPESASSYRIIGGYEDVTDRSLSDRKNQTSEIDEIFKTLGLILSHELRNPLVSLKTFAQLLGVKNKNVPLPNDFVTTIQMEVERLESVADGLFGLNDMDKVRIEATDIRVIINRIVKDFDQSRVSVKLGQNIASFNGDATRIELALSDMIQHMYSTMSDKGSLVILVEGKRSKGTQIIVRGRNIEEEMTFPSSESKTQPEAISLRFFKACQIVKKHRGLVRIKKSQDGYDLNILIREPA